MSDKILTDEVSGHVVTVSTADREELLDDELLQPVPSGLRPFSVGILKLCRKFDLSLATPGGAARKLSEDEASREMIIIAWLLDERHSIAEITSAPSIPPADFADMMEEYEFAMEIAFLMSVKAEVTRTTVAAGASLFKIAQKPGQKAGPSPPGK